MVRSCEDVKVIKKFPALHSTFWSESALKDHRYPGKNEEDERKDASIGFYWIMTIEDAKFIDGGENIIAQYQNNMVGLYDKRILFYETQTERITNNMLLTSDPETADWGQPAGFSVGHIRFYGYIIRKRKL